MKFQHLLAPIAAAAALAAAMPAALAQTASERALAELAAGKARAVRGELIVQLRRDADPAAAKAALDALGAHTVRMLRTQARRTDGKGDLRLVRLPDGFLLAEAIRRLGADPSVEFAEPNWIAGLHTAPAPDPLYADGSMWGMYGAESPLQQNPFGSQAGEAFAAGKRCNGALHVGMIDTGIMVDHEDLAANVWTNPADPENGIDDDGNGLVDDVHGWNFRGKKAQVFSGSEDDHGTHTSGTIGAVRLNGKGVVGVCDRVTLISAKAFGTVFGIGRTADIIEAIDYITDLKVFGGVDIVATNNSWGSSAFSQATYDAVARQTAAGIVVVASAGNNGANSDVSPSYPAAFDLPGIISVAALASSGQLWSGSNWGPTTVDLAAPGADVMSSVVGPKVDGVFTSGYGRLTGTSMAAPHVTGAVVLFKSLHPDASPAQIKKAILAAAEPTPSLAGRVLTGGRLDVSKF